MYKTNLMPTLQEKSASGAVASFNTALAMPLPSCNIAVNAWQEGSGDPSPVNNRPIHGFSEVNATRAGKNLCPYDNLTGTRRVSKNISLLVGSYVFSALCTSTDTDSTVCSFMFQYTDGTYSALRQIQRDVRSSNTINIQKPTRSLYVYASNADNTSVNDDFTFSDIQIEAGSTATDYEPYVTPTIYTIQLGQEVYGAEIDVVSGELTITHILIDLGDLSYTLATTYTPGYYRFNSTDYRNKIVGAPTSLDLGPCVCDHLEHVTVTDVVNQIDGIALGSTGTLSIYLNDYATDTIENFKTAVTGWKVKVELLPEYYQTYQLTPTQIETLIGNNTIFADTGDIDLTYKDLDIAKRGNFREVFRLPS